MTLEATGWSLRVSATPSQPWQPSSASRSRALSFCTPRHSAPSRAVERRAR
ncbi:hypothetical protein [Kitasatospora fiedleri]|uniref:hypothetical protein n=1 Tax=Kitasatospora fiedleri TaxID=2991545 RepID=UPI00249C7886|nr:hypothetical protein [Kitasatospora fiedleri]